MRLTPVGKIVIVLLVIGFVSGIWRYWNRIAPSAQDHPSVVPKKIDLPTGSNDAGSTGSATTVTLPTGDTPGCADKPEVRLLGYAWNAQMGMLFANGGAQATKGSLMCQHGVNFKWSRQDDNGKMQEALVAFATDLSRGTANPTRGAHFVTIMGDGGASFLQGLNTTLKRLGPDYQAKIVDAIGYSHGEDKFMGPAEWKTDPSASRGGLCAGVVRDGDWNIAQKWLGDNGLRTNPDEKTWDPDALNWVNASDYIDAAQKYIAGYSETRPVVRNGKKTGETKLIKVNSLVTWTPGDVTVAQKKGGLVSIVSTQEYSSQMPCVVIGIDKWMRRNRETVVNMIQAIAEGSNEVKSSEAALKRASEISNTLYKEPNTGPEYWEKYYKGTQEQDATGQTVALGGSSVNNLADSLLAFGLVPGSANLVAATYTVFGDLDVSQFPHLVPTYPPAGQVIDSSYLQAVASRLGSKKIIVAQLPKARPAAIKGKTMAHVMSRKAVYIHFDPGKATFSPGAQRLLQQLSRELLVASGTVVEIHGHTDSAGDPRKSMPLSESRAFAVKQWLEKQAPVNFPAGRIRVFAHGESQPLAPNSTAEGRAKNRRVEIVLGTTK